MLLDRNTIEAIQAVGRNILHEKLGGVTFLGHHHPRTVASRPHDHGRTWVMYGVVSGKTAMYDYARTAKRGTVDLVNSYWVTPGQSYLYKVGDIHSHQTYGDSRLIRIEGLNLWRKSNKAGGASYIYKG